MFDKRCYDMPKQKGCTSKRDIYNDINIEQNYNEINTNEFAQQNMAMPFGGGCACPRPIIEQPIVKCVHRTFNHTVPHVCPIKTKIINHHIYRHTYQPSYSCEEQNDFSQINEGSCCQFK